MKDKILCGALLLALASFLWRLVRIPLIGSAMLLMTALSPALASTGSICLDACHSRHDACVKSAPEPGCDDALHACKRKCYHMPWRRITPRPK